MGMGLPVEGEGWWRIEIGEDGVPHGVSTFRVAASVKFSRAWMPVPPITAILTGSVGGEDATGDGSLPVSEDTDLSMTWDFLPFFCREL